MGSRGYFAVNMPRKLLQIEFSAHAGPFPGGARGGIVIIGGGGGGRPGLGSYNSRDEISYSRRGRRSGRCVVNYAIKFRSHAI